LTNIPPHTYNPALTLKVPFYAKTLRTQVLDAGNGNTLAIQSNVTIDATGRDILAYHVCPDGPQATAASK